jgi:hypothetical protein
MNPTKWHVETMQNHIRLQPWMVLEEGRGRQSNVLGLAEIANQFESISLKDMDSVALLNRIDTKFILTTRQLYSTLLDIQENYWILAVNEHRLNHYRTLYYDTPNFDLYLAHVNERAERYKVRCREYIDSNLSFLEVKQKTRKGRTIKDRIKTDRLLVKINVDGLSWLDNILPQNNQLLQPKMWNHFTRITLVSKTLSERVTLDIDLSFQWKDTIVPMRNLVIAEVKMDNQSQSSPFLAQMREQKIHPQGFSKYCIGVAMIYDQVKKNSLKPKMMRIQKITGGLVSYE